MDGTSARRTNEPNLQGFSPSLQRARKPFLIPNIIVGSLVASFVCGVYVYAISAVKQDDFVSVCCVFVRWSEECWGSGASEARRRQAGAESFRAGYALDLSGPHGEGSCKRSQVFDGGGGNMDTEKCCPDEWRSLDDRLAERKRVKLHRR